MPRVYKGNSVKHTLAANASVIIPSRVDRISFQSTAGDGVLQHTLSTAEEIEAGTATWINTTGGALGAASFVTLNQPVMAYRVNAGIGGCTFYAYC